MKYIILKHKSMSVFIEQVNTEMNNGYIPVGSFLYISSEYHQAMYKL